MNAVIYARFSSDKQTEMSIDAQVRACSEYALKENILITGIYKDEAVSGTTAEREQYQQMLMDAMDDKFEMILIHKYDRIARNLEEQVLLHKRLDKLNIKLVAVAQNYGEGKDANLSKGIQWVLGEYYSANLAEETRKGHKEIALKGMHNGGCAPFGYDVVNKKYVINESEAYWVRRMYSTCLSGEPFGPLIDEMEKAGITGKRGKPIKFTQIYEILNNEKYTGTYVYSPIEEKDRNLRRSKPNAIRIENAFDAIIDKETYEKALEYLSEHRHAGKQKHPCSGLVYCKCGAKMHISHTTRKGHQYSRFICSKQCGMHGISSDKIDESVQNYLNELLSEKNISEVETAIAEAIADNRNRTKTFKEETNKKISQLEFEVSNLVIALGSGEFKDNYAFLNNRITEKREQIEYLKKLKPPVVEDKRIKGWIEAVKSNIKTPKAFIDRIDVNDDIITIYSTFGNIGCGDSLDTLPSVLYSNRVRHDKK